MRKFLLSCCAELVEVIVEVRSEWMWLGLIAVQPAVLSWESIHLAMSSCNLKPVRSICSSPRPFPTNSLAHWDGSFCIYCVIPMIYHAPRFQTDFCGGICLVSSFVLLGAFVTVYCTRSPFNSWFVY